MCGFCWDHVHHVKLITSVAEVSCATQAAATNIGSNIFLNITANAKTKNAVRLTLRANILVFGTSNSSALRNFERIARRRVATMTECENVDCFYREWQVFPGEIH